MYLLKITQDGVDTECQLGSGGGKLEKAFLKWKLDRDLKECVIQVSRDKELPAKILGWKHQSGSVTVTQLQLKTSRESKTTFWIYLIHDFKNTFPTSQFNDGTKSPRMESFIVVKPICTEECKDRVQSRAQWALLLWTKERGLWTGEQENILPGPVKRWQTTMGTEHLVAALKNGTVPLEKNLRAKQKAKILNSHSSFR